jgi:hypothetical protein
LSRPDDQAAVGKRETRHKEIVMDKKANGSPIMPRSALEMGVALSLRYGKEDGGSPGRGKRCALT